MEEKSNKPKDTDFVQQRLKAYQPIYSLESTIGTLVGLSLLFLVYGFVLFNQANSVVEVTQKYNNCGPNCTLSVTIPNGMEPPIYIYYEMKNFYQNHRKYMKSKSFKQLMGNTLSKGDLGDCSGVIEGKDLYVDYYLNGEPINDTDVANPCGLIARSVFNDTFKLYGVNGDRLNIREDGIAWESDLRVLYKHAKNYQNISWIDVKDEHFIVWMRTALTKNFRKMWGRLTDTKLEPGTYSLEIENNYDVSGWNGEKNFVITTVTPLGGRNFFLGSIFLFVSMLCLFVSMFFCGRAMISKKGSVSVEQLAWA